MTCEADEVDEVVELVLEDVLVLEGGGGATGLATGAGSGASFEGPLTGGRSGPDPCAAAGPAPTPSPATTAAAKRRTTGGRLEPAPPNRRSRSTSGVNELPLGLVQVVLPNPGGVVNVLSRAFSRRGAAVGPNAEARRPEPDHQESDVDQAEGGADLQHETRVAVRRRDLTVGRSAVSRRDLSTRPKQ